jgi:hypothetical protein
MNKAYLILLLLICIVAGLGAQSAEFSSYMLLKEIDIPDYDEGRFNFTIESYTWENFVPNQGWQETIYSMSFEFGFWTFPIGDLNVGFRLPYYFWFAKNGLRDENNSIPEARTKVTGFMDPELFAQFKLDITNNISALFHGMITVPGLAERAADGGAAIGETRGELMAGFVFEYRRMIAKVMGGLETGSELGNTPPVYIAYRVPSLFVPQVTAWDETLVNVVDIEAIFCATAQLGFGVQYYYKEAYFNSNKWTNAFFQPINETPDDLGMLTIKLYYASTTGGFYSLNKGSIFSFGIGMGGVGTDPDANPDIFYHVALSKYF